MAQKHDKNAEFILILLSKFCLFSANYKLRVTEFLEGKKGHLCP